MIYIFKATQKRVNPFAAYADENGVRYPRVPRELLDEVPEPSPPEDYSEDTYFRVEVSDAPYVVYERKPREMLLSERRSRLESDIAQKEASTLLARPVRDVLLVLMETTAAQQGITPKQLEQVNPGYAKVKQLDREIAAARDEIRTISAEIGEKPTL